MEGWLEGDQNMMTKILEGKKGHGKKNKTNRFQPKKKKAQGRGMDEFFRSFVFSP